MPSACSNNFKLVRLSIVYLYHYNDYYYVVLSGVSLSDYKKYATHIVVVQTSLSRFLN